MGHSVLCYASILHLPVNTPLKTWLLPPSDASHSIEDNKIWESVTTISRISGLLRGSSLRHHLDNSATCNDAEVLKRA